MSEHKLKTIARYWDAVADGRKTFEVRRNDRAFQTGDILVLEKYSEEGRYLMDGYDFTAKPLTIRKRITYLLQGGQFGIDAGYCVLGLADVAPTPPTVNSGDVSDEHLNKSCA